MIKNHKAEFELFILEKLGQEYKDNIEWNPRGICIAENFNKYDISTVEIMNVEILLVQYYVYGGNNDLIAFDNINKFISSNIKKKENNRVLNNKKFDNNSYEFIYNNLTLDRKKLVDEISFEILELGEDISENILQTCKSFKKIRNFASIVVRKNKDILIYLSIKYNEGAMGTYNNISNYEDKGHWGSGDVQIKINNINEFREIFKFIEKSYREN